MHWKNITKNRISNQPKNKEHNLNSIDVIKKSDFELDNNERDELLSLLDASFPGYFKDRIFYKQIPTIRLLAKYNGAIVGQVAVEYRAIVTNDEEIIYIFGLVDLCVTNQMRSQGIAAMLIETVQKIAQDSMSIDCLMLFTDDKRIYEKLGFQEWDTRCRFLAIDELRSIDVLEKKVDAFLMVKPVKAGFNMKTGVIDMLGYVF